MATAEVAQHAGPHDRSGIAGSCSLCYEHAVEQLKRQRDVDVMTFGSRRDREQHEKEHPKMRETERAKPTCRDCGAEVEWTKVAKSGKPFLLDVESRKPRPGEKLYVLISGSARRAEAQDEKLHREPRTCHWDTCSEKRG